MYPDLSLKENVTHGTPKNPIHGMHFTAGEDTPYHGCFFVERHWHNYVEILLVTKGQYVVEINLENHLLNEGDICILNSGDLHQITGQRPDAVHDVVLFDPQILDFSYADEWEERYIAPFLSQALILQNILLSKDEGHAEILGTVKDLMKKALLTGPGWYVECKLLLLKLFHLMTRYRMLLPSKEVLSPADARKIGRYKTIVSYIEEHYKEPVSLEQLADAVPCNSQYLCRSFREIAGASPIQYLISYRLDRACELLRCTARPVTDIALECGFENISYFIRKFKAVKGYTPKEYRESFLSSGQ